MTAVLTAIVPHRAIVRADSVATVWAAALAGAVGNAIDQPAFPDRAVAPVVPGTVLIGLTRRRALAPAGGEIADVAQGAVVRAGASAAIRAAALAFATGSAFVPAVEVKGGVVNAALENEEYKAYRNRYGLMWFQCLFPRFSVDRVSLHIW